MIVPCASDLVGVWTDGPEGRAILGGERSLADLADRVIRSGTDPQPRSGRQEFLESLVNRYV